MDWLGGARYLGADPIVRDGSGVIRWIGVARVFYDDANRPRWVGTRQVLNDHHGKVLWVGNARAVHDDNNAPSWIGTARLWNFQEVTRDLNTVLEEYEKLDV